MAYAKVAKKTFTNRKRPDVNEVLALLAYVESAALFLEGDIAEWHGK